MQELDEEIEVNIRIRFNEFVVGMMRAGIIHMPKGKVGYRIGESGKTKTKTVVVGRFLKSVLF